MRQRLLVSILFIALVFSVLLPFTANAAPITFGHTWGTADRESVTAAVADAAGNVTLAGIQQNLTTFESHVFVAKFDSTGRFLWNREFPFLHTVNPDMSLAPNGDVVLLANTTGGARPPSGSVNGTSASFVCRLSSAGSLVFAENISQIPLPARIATDPSTGGFVVAGFGDYGISMVAAFDSAGALRWARITPGGTTRPVGVAVDGSGRVYVLVSRLSGNAGIIAFDGSGNLVAQKIIGSFSTQYITPLDLAATSSGPLVLGATNGAIFLSQLTPSLGVSWTTLARGGGWSDAPSRLVGLSDGSFATLGVAYSGVNATVASNVYHFSSTGAIVSGSSYVSPAESQGLGQGFSLAAGAALSGGGLVLAGWTLGVSPQSSSAVTVNTAAPSVSWSADTLSWSNLSVTATAMSVSLLNRSVPVDNWNELADEQAWYGETSLPASKLTITVTTKQPSPSSPNVNFTATVSGGRKPFTFAWSFGDGSFASGSATPSHTYPQDGRYLAQVTVMDTTGLIGYGSTVVTVTGPPRILTLNRLPNGTAFPGDYVFFFAIALDPDGGTITTYQWSFGDGSVSVTCCNSNNHVYSTPGTYTMTLTVTDSDQGLTASASIPVNITKRPDIPPVALLIWSPYRPTAGSPVSFYGYYSYDPDGYITRYAWNFGDGTSTNASGCCAVHTYRTPRTYAVTLTVTDNAGLTGTNTTNVTVVPDVPPVANFSWYPMVPSVNQTVFFNAGSFSYDPDGYIVSWVWDFGDGAGGNRTGNTSNGGPFPVHVYTKFGNFVVTLNVTDNANLSAHLSKTIFVNAPPIAAFTTSETVGKTGTPIVFNASASSDPDGDRLNYSWTFGDGSRGTGKVVSHVFAVSGQYQIVLFVTDPYVGSFASAYLPVVLPKSPTAVIAWSPSRPVAGQTTVTFSGVNSFDPDGPIVTYVWEFGDGIVGSGRTATHTYANAGTYTVELIVVDEDGIANRDTQTITVVVPSKGTVITASLATPLANAQVTLSEGGFTVLAVLTAPDGSFSLGGLAPGTYEIAISKAGYETYAGTLVWDGLNGDLGTFVLTLVPTSSSAPATVSPPIGIVMLLVVGAATLGVAAYLIRKPRRRVPPRREGP